VPVFVEAVIALMIWVLPYLADRLLPPHLKNFAATLVYSLAITTMSYISARANPMGSIGGYKGGSTNLNPPNTSSGR
jgi:hypothetical protein